MIVLFTKNKLRELEKIDYYIKGFYSLTQKQVNKTNDNLGNTHNFQNLVAFNRL